MAQPSKALKAANAAKSKKIALAAKSMKDRQLAKAKGQETAAITKLKPVAKEINERLVKASKLTSDAFDHRLAAAIRLEDARKMCKKANMNFKTWAEANVKHSYENVRKLAAIGASDNPKLALEDMRITTRKAVAKHAARRATVLARNPNPGGEGLANTASNGSSRTAWEIAEDMVASLSEKEQISLIEARASLIGRKVITAEYAADAKAALAPSAVTAQMKGIKVAFQKLKASRKMTFLRWAAGEVGASVTSVLSNGSGKADDDHIPETGGIDVPESMRR